MTSRRIFWCASGLLGSVALLLILVVPDLAAQRRSESLSTPATVPQKKIQETTVASVAGAVKATRPTAPPVVCSFSDDSVLQARELNIKGESAKAEQILRALISSDSPCKKPSANTLKTVPAIKNRARLQLVKMLQD